MSSGIFESVSKDLTKAITKSISHSIEKEIPKRFNKEIWIGNYRLQLKGKTHKK